jgi:hypothetical protein
MLVPAQLTLTAACSSGSAGTRIITVTASYGFEFVVPFLTVGPTLSATAALSY